MRVRKSLLRQPAEHAPGPEEDQNSLDLSFTLMDMASLVKSGGDRPHGSYLQTTQMNPEYSGARLPSCALTVGPSSQSDQQDGNQHHPPPSPLIVNGSGAHSASVCVLRRCHRGFLPDPAPPPASPFSCWYPAIESCGGPSGRRPLALTMIGPGSDDKPAPARSPYMRDSSQHSVSLLQ
uniref:Uncharacterized protein n=1 Tax=Knipowitschia caucasica TaxID=637954 RepID=A0AAV2LDT6_KNICA